MSAVAQREKRTPGWAALHRANRAAEHAELLCSLPHCPSSNPFLCLSEPKPGCNTPGNRCSPRCSPSGPANLPCWAGAGAGTGLPPGLQQRRFRPARCRSPLPSRRCWQGAGSVRSSARGTKGSYLGCGAGCSHLWCRQPGSWESLLGEQGMPSARSPELAAGRPCCTSCRRGAARMASSQALAASAQPQVPGSNSHSEHAPSRLPGRGQFHSSFSWHICTRGREGRIGAVFCHANEASLSAPSLCFLCWGHSHILAVAHPHVAVLALL